MSPTLERQVMKCVTQYKRRQQWKAWGLHKLRKQGAAVLLEGPPGVGKTVIAEYLALRIRKKGIKEVSFADFGSHVPGENARQIRNLFEQAKENGEMTIYIDECDTILWDRDNLGPTSMWMLEIINELLVQIGKYPGLTILSTNRPQLLDKALRRRLLAIIRVDRPEFTERLRIWKDKMPDEFPLKLSIDQFAEVASLQLTGAEIENAIIDCASLALEDGKKPTYRVLLECARNAKDETTTTTA